MNYRIKAPVACLMPLLLLNLTFAQTKGYQKYAGYKNNPKTNIAVSQLEGRGLSPGEGETLTDALRSYLINTNTFRVMERGQMDVILKEQGFQASGACSDEACIVEMGQLLGVQNVISGSIGKVGATFSVNVRMISIQTGEILRTVNRFYKGQIDGLLTEVIPAIATELAGNTRQASVSEPQAAVPAESKKGPKGEKKTVSKKSGGSSKLLWIGLGTLAAAGGGAAFFILKKKEKTETGSVEFTW